MALRAQLVSLLTVIVRNIALVIKLIALTGWDPQARQEWRKPSSSIGYVFRPGQVHASLLCSLKVLIKIAFDEERVSPADSNYFDKVRTLVLRSCEDSMPKHKYRR